MDPFTKSFINCSVTAATVTQNMGTYKTNDIDEYN